uniref:Protein HGH1 N-terminal domain-containing protein n=1 Tax=Oryzias sinensis TaxID=183150 RepID=A0A8C7X6P6_9TELE
MTLSMRYNKVRICPPFLLANTFLLKGTCSGSLLLTATKNLPAGRSLRTPDLNQLSIYTEHNSCVKFMDTSFVLTRVKALQEDVGLAKLVDIFCAEAYNAKANLHYLGPLLSNLTQLPEARHTLMDRDRCVFQRLLPFTQYQASVIRRGGVVGTLRNCCFDHSEETNVDTLICQSGAVQTPASDPNSHIQPLRGAETSPGVQIKASFVSFCKKVFLVWVSSGCWVVVMSYMIDVSVAFSHL